MLLQHTVERVLVTGATGFLGFRVVAALLERGLEVGVLINRDQQDKLVTLADQVQIVYGDLWNKASLKGQARGYQAVVHLVGSAKADPSKGLTYQQINLVAARHAVGMAVSDGVLNFILLSVAALPSTLPTEYIRSKRDSEDYLFNSGLHGRVVRAPQLFAPTWQHPLLQMMAFWGWIPPLRWIIGRYMPLSVDLAARGIAAIVHESPSQTQRFFYAHDLRRLGRGGGRLRIRPPAILQTTSHQDDALENVPFGWLPPKPLRRR